MTSLIAIDRDTIRHDSARSGVTFRYSDGARVRDAFVPDAATAGVLKLRSVSAQQAEGFVRNMALKLAMHLANRREAEVEPEAQLSLDDLRKIR